jgi:hypothetical protein
MRRMYTSKSITPVLDRHPVGFRIASVTLALQFPVPANTSPEVPFGLHGIRVARLNICNPAASFQLGTNSPLTRHELKYHDYRILSVVLNVILRLFRDAVSSIEFFRVEYDELKIMYGQFRRPAIQSLRNIIKIQSLYIKQFNDNI